MSLRTDEVASISFLWFDYKQGGRFLRTPAPSGDYMEQVSASSERLVPARALAVVNDMQNYKE